MPNDQSQSPLSAAKPAPDSLALSPASTEPAVKLAKKQRKPRAPDTGVHLIYKIEGRPHEVDVFQLGMLLEAIGNILIESNRLTSPGDEASLNVSVAPFERGSFIMDFILQLKQNAGFLLLLSQTEEARQLKAVLEDIGLVQRVVQKGASLLQLLKNLGPSRQSKIEQKGPDDFEYTSEDGGITNVSMQVNKMYNHGTINNYILPALASPLETNGVQGISTFLKGAEKETGVRLDKTDAKWMRSYAEPEEEAQVPERIVNNTIQLLHPKSGNYGETSGLWTFTVVGSKRTIKATISHADF